MPRKIDPGTLQVGAGTAPQSSVESAVEASSVNVTTHLSTPAGAHPASAIDIDGLPEDVFNSGTVEGALDELSGLIPPRPAKMGEFRDFILQTLGISGIPDWGVLKLSESSLDDRSGATALSIDTADAYAYYYRAPEWADDGSDPPFSTIGDDPQTDPDYNVADGTYTGGGPGLSFVGAIQRGGPAIQTARVLPYEPTGRHVVVSGIVHPADRGVLALLHWPAGGDVAAFLAQPLTERCVAALLLGNGILVSGSSTGCDGTPGGIFTIGSSGGGLDPYVFPGAASGQYGLQEIHTGTSVTGGPAPVADPSAGQVRLGTDANAGVPVVAGGIPILGATAAATGGGNVHNFFTYRLPLLDDYTQATGLKYTPADEKLRYFLSPVISTPAVDPPAGRYPNFVRDYWPYQIARYRHRFAMDATATPTSIRESGSYILLHFRNEVAFEALVRDGVVPTADVLYGANLVNWVDPEDPANIATASAPDYPAASSYHVLRSTVVEDPGTSPGTVTRDKVLNPNGSFVTSVSGVHYFSPGTAPSNFELSIDFEFDDYPTNSFRLGTPEGGYYLGGLSPVAVSLSNYSRSSSPTYIVTPAPEIVAGQRIEYTLVDLGFSLASPPTGVDNIDLEFDLSLSGDDATPSFSVDARVQAFLRHPQGHAAAADVNVYEELSAETGTNLVLFHSGRTDPIAVGFGNPVNINVVNGFTVPSSLYSAEKDVKERFLDEVYRFRHNDPTDPNKLYGPGLPPGDAGYNAVEVRDSDWLFPNRFHELDLNNALGDGALQVAGLPLRGPSLTHGLFDAPSPSTGILIYPQDDYTTSTRPNGGDYFLSQPNYGSRPGTGDRHYIRLFDAEFSRDGSPAGILGSSFVTLRFWGLQLSDFAYSAPGPGGVGIALMVKIPGFTTWMDLGRADGDGPSKQHPFDDGAGCQVIGPETIDGVDEASGIVYCDVRAHVGPAAVFYANGAGEAVLAFKAIIKDNATGYGLKFNQVPYTGDPASLRGLITVEIVKPTS